jgi:hypothetical protein
MKTKAEAIDRTVYVFAEAKTPHQLENLSPGELPFEYRVKQYDYGDESSVRVHEQKITVHIPGGIDLTLECVKNLEEKIIDVQKTADADIQDLRARIKALALIEYKPE